MCVFPNVCPTLGFFGDRRCVNVWEIFCFSRSCPSGCWLWFVFNAQVSLNIFPNEIECGKNVDLLSDDGDDSLAIRCCWTQRIFIEIVINRLRNDSQNYIYINLMNWPLQQRQTVETTAEILITIFRHVFFFVRLFIINRSRSETGWTLSVKCWFCIVCFYTDPRSTMMMRWECKYNII